VTGNWHEGSCIPVIVYPENRVVSQRHPSSHARARGTKAVSFVRPGNTLGFAKRFCRSLMGGLKMARITFVIDRRKRLNGRDQFTIVRIREQRLDVVSHHETTDQAFDVAQRYVSQAKHSGLDARVFRRD
jgi:hypothetical protein